MLNESRFILNNNKLTKLKHIVCGLWRRKGFPSVGLWCQGICMVGYVEDSMDLLNTLKSDGEMI